jgi:hypothetical protein
MVFLLYVENSPNPIWVDAGTLTEAADVVLVAAERTYFRGIIIDGDGSILERQAPVPFEAVTRVERHPLYVST